MQLKSIGHNPSMHVVPLELRLLCDLLHRCQQRTALPSLQQIHEIRAENLGLRSSTGVPTAICVNISASLMSLHSYVAGLPLFFHLRALTPSCALLQHTHNELSEADTWRTEKTCTWLDCAMTRMNACTHVPYTMKLSWSWTVHVPAVHQGESTSAKVHKVTQAVLRRRKHGTWQRAAVCTLVRSGAASNTHHMSTLSSHHCGTPAGEATSQSQRHLQKLD